MSTSTRPRPVGRLAHRTAFPNPTPVFSPDLTSANIAAVNRILETPGLSPRASDRRLPSSDVMTASPIDQVGDVLALALTPPQ